MIRSFHFVAFPAAIHKIKFGEVVQPCEISLIFAFFLSPFDNSDHDVIEKSTFRNIMKSVPFTVFSLQGVKHPQISQMITDIFLVICVICG